MSPMLMLAALVCSTVALAACLRWRLRQRDVGGGDLGSALWSFVKSLLGEARTAQDGKATEDRFYEDEYGGKDPMVGKFWFEDTSEEEFMAVVEAFGLRLKAFLDEEYGARGMREDPGRAVLQEAASPQMSQTDLFCDLVIMRHHPGSRCINTVLNHAFVGGGDYLRLGMRLLHSQAADLLKLPQSKLLVAYCSFRVLVDMLHAVAMGHAGRMLSGPTQRYRGRFQLGAGLAAGGGAVAGRRFLAAVALCEEVCRCTSWEAFHVIFPVGISKEGSDVSNAVGACRVRFCRGMTAAQLFRAAQQKWYWVVSTGHYSTQVKGNRGSSKASGFARSIADVVCTIAAFRRREGPDLTRRLTAATGTTHAIKFYPVYLWGMVEDDTVHWGVTAVTTEFSPNFSPGVGGKAFEL